MKKPYDLTADYQPAAFTFANKKAVEEAIARYPEGQQASAVMPLLWIAQRQHDNWIPRAAMDEIAKILSMPPVKVYEVASFYTMYNLAPIGRYHVQCCGTTPCWLRGSERVMAACAEAAARAPDGLFTVSEVECLGACTAAPVLQVNDDTYEGLTPASAKELMALLEQGIDPKAGDKQ
ncbi:MAG TPA: NAD(P)H-dependent oxidoreductase subunit E [Rhodospirillaceae bacterium]|jgi:NADH-quinone oxidoreductase E subunit|nr:NAD(P)H-dependent oxidoreductase subunit E [Alphaproteobacteria bacterium]HBH26170.1 NAD(P)H-dependent oxidoreductase subunit E [Rhodospirillaceae bacterium]